MRAIDTEYYGDDVRWFMGEVKSIQDPDELGRVRVRIFGIHSGRAADVADTDLPWANVVLPVTQGGTSTTTQATGIQIGAKVFGIFADGRHSQIPIVLGSIPNNPAFRVKYDGPPQSLVVAASSRDTYKSGDKVSAETNKVLESNGQATGAVGAELSAEQLSALNAVSVSSGTLDIQLVGESREQQAVNFLKARFSEMGHKNPGFLAQAFVGNFLHEGSSGGRLDPTIKGDGGNAIGIAQWNGKRKGYRYYNLTQYAISYGAGIGNFALQLSFVVHELKHGQRKVWSYLQSATTIESATETVFATYERPAVANSFTAIYTTGLGGAWRTHMTAGGIKRFADNQTNIVKDYRAEYEKRLASAKGLSIYGSEG